MYTKTDRPYKKREGSQTFWTGHTSEDNRVKGNIILTDNM